MEAPLAGSESKYTGYPAFNSPSAIADAVQWAGIDLVFTAHNHCLDRGVTGIQKTLAYLDKIGLPSVGCNHNQEGKRYRIFQVKGFKLAFLAYTTTTNGIALPAGKDWLVNVYDTRKIAADISDAKQNGADAIIFVLHTGIEYQRLPSAEQQKLIDQLISMGVDIVLGSHVHVIQPVELRNRVDSATGKTRTCFIAYSVGNFLSNQRWRYSDCGLMVTLQLEKIPGQAGITIDSYQYTPLWVNRFSKAGKLNYRIKAIEDPNAVSDPDVDADGRWRIKQVWQETKELIDKWNKKN